MAKPTGRSQPPRTWEDLRTRIDSWGWRTTTGGGGHVKVYDGDVLVTCLPVSPGDNHRAVRNKWTEIRRYRRMSK